MEVTNKKSNHQFLLFQAAHHLKDDGYTIKMCDDPVTDNTTAIFILSPDKYGPTYYISADDFNKRFDKPMYRIGFVEVNENGDCVCHEYYRIDDLSKYPSKYYIELVKKELTISDKDNFIIQSMMRNHIKFIEWAKNYGLKVFIRKYDIDGRIVKTTNF